MEDRDIAHWRMHNLALSRPAFDAAQDVVRWLGAVQSQDYGPAKWSAAMRTGGVSDAAVDRAFADGEILRTHVLRPTWHFVIPADIRWMLQVTAPRVQVLNAHMYRELGLDDTVLARCNTLLVDALHGGRQRTRQELATRLANAGIAAKGFQLGYVLMNAELNGIICSGALNGKQHTYALLDERAPQTAGLTDEQALAELTVRYFTSHGPATAKDFKAWASLTAADVRTGLEMVAPQLERQTFRGLTFWFAAPAAFHRASPPTVHLLQAYDEYFMGYRESRAVVDASGAAASHIRGRGAFNGVVILDGQVAGHWRRTLRKDTVVIQTALYEPFDAAGNRALRAAGDRHGAFLGRTATVVAA